MILNHLQTGMDPPWGGHERGRPVKRTPFFAVVGVWAGHVKDKKEVKGADRESWGYGGSLA